MVKQKTSSKASNTRSQKRKWNLSDTLTAALIGLVATIIAALLGSPIIEKLLFAPEITPTPILSSTGIFSSIPLATIESGTPRETAIPAFTPTVPNTPTFTSTFTPTTTYTVTNTQTPTPVVILENGVPMVLISGGFFNKYDKEKGYIQISLPSYYIDQHEVTNSQYEECVDANVCATPFTDADREYENVKHFGDTRYADFPVVLVSYYMSKTYCEWRSNDTRMPSGDEWEKAARGMLVNQPYPWGDDPPVCSLGSQSGANYLGCNSNDAFPVNSFAPNGYGVYDMAGNVSEWVEEGNRLIRGGSWNDNESHIKVFSIAEGYTFNGYVNVGFRCARDANP